MINNGEKLFLRQHQTQNTLCREINGDKISAAIRNERACVWQKNSAQSLWDATFNRTLDLTVVVVKLLTQQMFSHKKYRLTSLTRA